MSDGPKSVEGQYKVIDPKEAQGPVIKINIPGQPSEQRKSFWQRIGFGKKQTDQPEPIPKVPKEFKKMIELGRGYDRATRRLQTQAEAREKRIKDSVVEKTPEELAQEAMIEDQLRRLKQAKGKS